MQSKKLLQKLLSGSKNVQFSDVVQCAKMFGFEVDRIADSHHIFKHPHIPELLNLQNVNGKAKSYQIKQLINIIERYDLRMEENK